MPNLPQNFIDTAIAAADAAREISLGYFRTGLAVRQKSDASPVTRADLETEQRLRELILARHPRHSLVGEEHAAVRNEQEWCWLVDPIDGTKSFASGNPTYGTLIALLHHSQPVLGLIDHAALDERWLGIAGRETTHNGNRCRTSANSDPAAGGIYATTVDMFSPPALARFNRLSQSFAFRAFGCDCYAYGLLASGFVSAVCEAGLRAHDFLALRPVVEGAGGVISDWHGKPLTLDSSGEVLACANQALHEAALANLAE